MVTRAGAVRIGSFRPYRRSGRSWRDPAGRGSLQPWKAPYRSRPRDCCCAAGALHAVRGNRLAPGGRSVGARLRDWSSACRASIRLRSSGCSTKCCIASAATRV